MSRSHQGKLGNALLALIDAARKLEASWATDIAAGQRRMDTYRNWHKYYFNARDIAALARQVGAGRDIPVDAIKKDVDEFSCPGIRNGSAWSPWCAPATMRCASGQTARCWFTWFPEVVAKRLNVTIPGLVCRRRNRGHGVPQSVGMRAAAQAVMRGGACRESGPGGEIEMEDVARVSFLRMAKKCEPREAPFLSENQNPMPLTYAHDWLKKNHPKDVCIFGESNQDHQRISLLAGLINGKIEYTRE